MSLQKQQSGVLENESWDFGTITGSGNKDFDHKAFRDTDRNHNNPINPSEVDGITCYRERIKETIAYDYYKTYGKIGECELIKDDTK